MLFERLDMLRARTTERLAELYKQRGFNHQAVWEREAFVAREVDRMERLLGVDRALCFGRLDARDGTVSHIGRIAIADDDHNPLLIDWRAPAAEPFYRATAANPGDLLRRRHIQVRHRRVVGVEDEVLAGPAADAHPGQLRGEAALLAAISAHRTGRMSDIVATIQAEQDRIIRAPLGGVLVVQGGPGTGKTVAALHRAAYLLYTHRERLERQGVLVIGPNRTFIRYIDQVLPALGETGVTLSPVSRLFPGVEAEQVDDAAAVVKGDLRMAGVIAAAVRHHQWLPRKPVPVHVDGAPTLEIHPDEVRAARSRARRSRRPHNEARARFTREILTGLARQRLQRAGDVADEEDVAEMRSELASEGNVQSLLDDLWPILTPQQLVSRLYSSRRLLAAAGRALTPDQRERLHAPRYTPSGPWTEADVPLLDEAAELLGEAPDPAAIAAARREEEQRRAEEQFAQDLLTGLDLGFPVDARQVAERYHGPSNRSTVGERAAGDRDWSYGHVIVDEAQELSPMAWRMIVRRVPSKSMTVVGDIAQTSAESGARSWADVLDPHVEGRWRLETLTVNYRTPAEVMDVAAAVLADIDPDLEPPRSVRRTGIHPWSQEVHPDKLATGVRDAVQEELDAHADGRLAVIAPRSLIGLLHGRLARDLEGDVALGTDDPSALDARSVVLTVAQVKGLEFDSVIVVEPALILDESKRGATDLYVAVTRPTQRLGIVHAAPLPSPLR